MAVFKPDHYIFSRSITRATAQSGETLAAQKTVDGDSQYNS